MDGPAAAHQLRRELGARDITLFGITCIINLRWIPVAAHAGPGSLVLWLLAALLFAAPVAVAVGALSVKYAGAAGGLYVWTRGDFGRWHGFLCFWVYWMAIAILLPSAALFYMSAGLHILGPQLAENRWYLVAVSLAAIWIALATNLLGVKIGKWTENIGGVSTWVLSALLLTVAVLVWMRRGSATPIHLAPRWSWDTLSLWAGIAYAMSGLEFIGMMGGEIRDPEHTLPRAGWIATAFVAVFYAASTLALLVLLRPENVTEMNGLAEGGDAAAAVFGTRWLSPVIALLILAGGLGQIGGFGAAVSRLPFAVGADGLLPPAFARVHPRWHTPHISIIVFGLVGSFLLVAMQLGDTMRAAYQSLLSLMVIVGFLPYLYIFGSAWKAGKRVSAVSGTAITALAIVCSLVPTADITSVWLFEAKLVAATGAVIASAWFVYRRAAASLS
ncbi:MAG TPA: APC family permease [Bryobacteraceae bacterium]|nr:APC family permease [Bryobacteraceae bacterium]